MKMSLPPRTSTAPLTFTLKLEPPGPSQGDAMEHLEHLGFDPRSFQSITLVREVLQGNLVAATFEITGDVDQLERVRRAREPLPAARRHRVNPWHG